MSVFDDNPHTVTEDDMHLHWAGERDARAFRCYLCGHRFAPGDECTWYLMSNILNPIVCVTKIIDGERVQGCDGPDVCDRWRAHYEDGMLRFHWMTRMGLST